MEKEWGEKKKKRKKKVRMLIEMDKTNWDDGSLKEVRHTKICLESKYACYSPLDFHNKKYFLML